MADEKIPGLIEITSDTLKPGGLFASDGPLATSVRENAAIAEDAPFERTGEGWEGRIGGFCPVQGDGTVDGKTWYFRARHDEWSFEVWDESLGPEGRLPTSEPRWWVVSPYGEGDHDASWMPFSHAWRFIDESIAAGRAQNWTLPDAVDSETGESK